MQQAYRDLAAISDIPLCKDAHTSLLSACNSYIKSFIAFLGNEGDAVVKKFMDEGSASFDMFGAYLSGDALASYRDAVRCSGRRWRLYS